MECTLPFAVCLYENPKNRAIQPRESSINQSILDSLTKSQPETQLPITKSTCVGALDRATMRWMPRSNHLEARSVRAKHLQTPFLGSWVGVPTSLEICSIFCDMFFKFGKQPLASKKIQSGPNAESIHCSLGNQNQGSSPKKNYSKN